MSTEAQIAANQANAQHSTGPQSAAGKAASSQNRRLHGLASGIANFAVAEGESQELYLTWARELRVEHQPSTATEEAIVERLAQHYWLQQRAIRLQNECFSSSEPDEKDLQRLAIYIRYATTHERAFHTCLADLLKLRAEKRKAEIGFESQKQKAEQHAYRKMVAEAETDLKITRAQCLKSADRRAQDAATAPATGFAAPKAA